MYVLSITSSITNAIWLHKEGAITKETASEEIKAPKVSLIITTSPKGNLILTSIDILQIKKNTPGPRSTPIKVGKTTPKNVKSSKRRRKEYDQKGVDGLALHPNAAQSRAFEEEGRQSYPKKVYSFTLIRGGF